MKVEASGTLRVTMTHKAFTGAAAPPRDMELSSQEKEHTNTQRGSKIREPCEFWLCTISWLTRSMRS